MASWTGQVNTVSLGWTPNLKGVYYRNQKIGAEFSPTFTTNSAVSVNTYVSVRGNNTCPGGTGAAKVIRIPGTIQYHAYSSSNVGSLKGGKLLKVGSTWTQIGIGRGLWYITATFTPAKCWRDRGIKVTRIITRPIWICNPCTNPWPLPCSC
jgi:hypothetical protein